MTITALPPPPSNSDNPTAFSSKASALLGALPQLVTEINNEVLVTIPGLVDTVANASATAINETIPAAVALVDEAVALTAMGQAIAAAEEAQQSSTTKTYQTKAAMQADVSQLVNQHGRVTLDATDANNGYYVWTGAAWVISKLQPVSSVTVAGIVSLLEPDVEMLKQSSVLPAIDLPWAVTDSDGCPILSVKHNGFGSIVTDELPGGDLLGDYAWAIVDADYVVLLGIKWDGKITAYGQEASDITVYADGPVGACDIYAVVGGDVYQVTSAGNNFSPVAGNGGITYLTRNGAVAQVNTELPIEGSVAEFINVILHVPGSGQSLSTGTYGAATTIQAPAANRLLTINDGVRLTNQDSVLDAAMVAPFKKLTAKISEPPPVQMAAQINRLRGLPGNAGFLLSCHGRGSYTVAQLSKGTQYYNNLITAVNSAKAECVILGYGYKVPFVSWIHGEADSSALAGAYTAAMLQLQIDYETDIAVISGQAGKIPILLDQISNFTAYGLTASNIPFEQLQLALLYPDCFVCAGPKYWLPTIEDGMHLTAESSMRLGAMHARAAMSIINSGTWLPTHCISAKRTGITVVLDFHTPFGGLTVDIFQVSDPGHWGIRWIDDGASASVSEVKLIGGNRVQITLTSVPTGANQQIGIADIGVSGENGGPLTGARSCLRDSSPDFDGYGLPVQNWACHQRISVAVN